jgi:O-antigen biosynthesis protein
MISCIMPTCNRRRFLAQAMRCFARRTYRHAELIVIDDSDRACRSVCEGLENVRYIRQVMPMPTGAKVNLGIEAARGDILQLVDDDDYYGPDFLATSVREVREAEDRVVARCCFLALVGRDPVLRHSGHGWAVGGTLCFRREVWKRKPFQETKSSYDSLFLAGHDRKIRSVCRPDEYIVIRHGDNTWEYIRERGAPEKQLTDDYLRGRAAYGKPLEAMMGNEDIDYYRRRLRWKDVSG